MNFRSATKTGSMHNHYEKIRPADTKWLYRQEQGYVESMKNITLEELAAAADR